MKFNFNNNRPIYIQLVEQLEQQIISGELKPGEKLLPVRDLAIVAKVNPNTLMKALAELEELKLITTERTNGKFVTTNEKRIAKFREKFAKQKTDEYLEAMAKIGFSKKEIQRYIKERI